MERILRLGLHLDGLLLLCVGDHVLPQGGDALFSALAVDSCPSVKRVQIQPQQQRFLGKDFLRRHLQSAESVPEIVEIGVEGAAVSDSSQISSLFLPRWDSRRA